MRRLFPDNTFVPPQVGSGLRLLIGEAPGSDEEAEGKPFVGGAGRWLDAMLPKAGVERKSLTVLNCIQCRPPQNIFPTDPDARKYISSQEGYEAVAHCRTAHVEPMLKARPWNRVDLMGDKALQFVAGKDGIYKWRGTPLKLPLLGDKYVAIATLHPAAIMRDQTMLPAVINDLRKGLEPPPEYYTLYPGVEDVRNFKATEFAFDIETSWQKVGKRDIKMIGLCAEKYRSIIVPFTGAYIPELRRIFANAKTVIGHNLIQFDLPQMEYEGIKIPDDCQIWDTMLLQHLRFPDLPHDLEFLGTQFTSKPAWKQDKSTLELYCARDTDVTLQCFEQLKPLITQHNLMNLYQGIQVPLAKMCYLMHKTGFKIDPEHIAEVRIRVSQEMTEEEKHLPDELRTRTNTVYRRHPAPVGTLSAKTGKPVKYIHLPEEESERPWASSDVVGRYLYETLGLPPVIDPKSERVTTGKMALERLYRKTGNRAIEAIRRLRKKASIMNLFAKEELMESGIQNPSMNPHGTSSGRLSSSNPNLQNITESVRFLYVPHTPGWKLIEVDYSQIENRLTAYLAGDKARLQRFIDNPDFSEHKYLASIFLSVPYDEVVKSSDPDSAYIKAKKIVHGTNYGEGAKKIALMNDLDFYTVKELQNMWKQAIHGTTKWQERTAAEAEKLGYLVTPFGRKRWFYTQSKYTESLSFLPQSTAADMIYRAMLALMYERINWPLERVQKVVGYVEPLPRPARLLLQVHDSLIIECPPEMVEQVSGVLKRVMEQEFKELPGFRCPISIKSGNSWGECE